MKIVLMGCNHAGTWAAKTLLKNKKANDEVVIFDKNNNTSFLGCGIALWVAGEVKDTSTLFYSSPEEMVKLGAKMHTEHEIMKVDSTKKIVYVKDLKTGKEFEETYDKLICGSGSWPIIPPFKGVDLEGILISKWYQHAQKIIEKVKDSKVKNVAVIGAGYIGVELAEAFDINGKNVIFIERSSNVVPNNFDPEIADKLHEGIKNNSKITLKMGESVEEFISDGKGHVKAVKTNKGTYDAEMVIMSIGFKASVEPLQGEIDLTKEGTIVVNEYFQTSNKDIYAIGDAVAQMYTPDCARKPVMLATNAVRSGVVAGMNILTNNSLKFGGVQGTHAINVFGWTLSGTGMTELHTKKVECSHKNVGSILVEDYDRPAFMKTREKVWFKVVYDKDTEEIIGAQIASKANHAEVMYMMSLAISKKVKISELGLIDTYFLPHLNNPINFITMATMKYLKLIE